LEKFQLQANHQLVLGWPGEEYLSQLVATDGQVIAIGNKSIFLPDYSIRWNNLNRKHYFCALFRENF